MVSEKINSLDWRSIQEELHYNGFTIVSNVLAGHECEQLKQGYDGGSYRKTINMERYRFGSGEYKYYSYPLPEIISALRTNIYPYLVGVANQWMSELRLDTRFPETHSEMVKLCHENNQLQPTPLILKYGRGGFNTLHQDLYGEVYFPMQVVFVLDEIDNDYTGGEFVITEQVPRAQSKANVLKPRKGDMLIFTTRFRPQRGSNGYYRVNMRHGVSPLHSGIRHSMGIIFHDAIS